MNVRLLVLLWLRRWHARIGFAAIVLVLLLALSGIALNHGHALGLDGRRAHSTWLAHWYGMVSEPPQAFRSGKHQLVAANGRWILDGRSVAEDASRPIGFVTLAGMHFIAAATEIHMIQADGALVDKLGKEMLPALPIHAIGTSRDRVVIATPGGNFASKDGLNWAWVHVEDIQWSAATQLAPGEEQVVAAELVPGISWQRLLEDVHSGRIFGRYGPLVMDLVGVVLTMLALSGAWLFLRPRHRAERERR